MSGTAYWQDAAQRIKQLNDAHEHVWVPSQLSGMFEECSVQGCTLARYSHSWISRMGQITGPADQPSTPLEEATLNAMKRADDDLENAIYDVK